MIVVVLMAGNSLRFKDKGYTTPKPFIDLNGATILDYTLQSIPEINNYKIYFTLRTEWDCNAEKRLSANYPGCGFVYFDKLTRGNLETAFLTISQITCDSNEDVMFLDCDNHYDGSGLVKEIHRYFGDFGFVCGFDPIDDSHKWGFVIPEGNMAVRFMEKDPKALAMGGLPMIGNFYFSSVKLFKLIAEKTLYRGAKVKNEFFMTQAVQKLLDNGIPVHIYKSPKMVPLGTPEDYEKAKAALR